MKKSRTRTEETETSEIESQEKRKKILKKKFDCRENEQGKSIENGQIRREIDKSDGESSIRRRKESERVGELGFQLLPVNEMEIRVSASAVPAFCSLVFVASARERDAKLLCS